VFYVLTIRNNFRILKLKQEDNMNVDELKKAIKDKVPNKAIESITKVVVAKKKKRGGYNIYPCVTEANLVNIPLLGGDCMAIVFED